MNRLFDMDNGIFRFLGRLADLIILNLIFLACCIPIVTIGASWTALYYMTLKMVRNEETYIVRGFFKSFKQNFRQATLLWLGFLVFILVMFFDFRIISVMGGSLMKAIQIGLMAISLLAALILMYLFPLLSKFYNSIRNTLRNALLMSIRHLPQTLLMLVITVGCGLVTFLNSYTLIYGILVWLMCGFAVVALINSYFLVKIFDRYIPETEEETTHEEPTFDSSAFKNLGVTDDGETTEAEESEE